MTKIENRKTGQDAKTFLSQQDSERRRYVATTADVAEGELTFGELEVCTRSYIKRDGTEGETLCFICKDSKGIEHGIAASAFLAKAPIYTRDAKTWSWVANPCPNLGAETMDFSDLWENILSKKKVTLHRLIGRRGNSPEKSFEYFTAK